MRSLTTLAAVGLAVVVLAPPAWGDWQPGMGHKMHYPQLPDLLDGMNVLATYPIMLADDFRCGASGPITDVHIWGSWLDDHVQPLHVDLYLFDDIPVGPGGYSIPGDLLWSRYFRPEEIVVGEIVQGEESFFDPHLNQIIGRDSMVVQYNFFIPEAEAFVQTRGKTYWLGVLKFNEVEEFSFGWKSSRDHWNDDAVWDHLIPNHTFDWRELRHPATGESLDLAFVITPEPATLALVGLGAAGLVARRRRK